MTPGVLLLVALLVCFFVLMFVAVPIGLVVLIRRRTAERSAPLRVQASSLGFSFSAGRCREVPENVMSSPLFAGSIDPKAYDVMRGDLGGTELLVFDHACVRSGNDSIAGGRQFGYRRRPVAAFRLAAPVPPEATNTSSVHEGWLLVSTSSASTPADRLAMMNDGVKQLAQVAPSQGTRAARALDHLFHTA